MKMYCLGIFLIKLSELPLLRILYPPLFAKQISNPSAQMIVEHHDRHYRFVRKPVTVG
jgi:hypothetical protein